MDMLVKSAFLNEKLEKNYKKIAQKVITAHNTVYLQGLKPHFATLFKY